MQKLRDYWTARSAQQRRTLVAAFLATFLAVIAFSWLAGQTTMSLLYAGLESSRAGEVVAEIEKRGITYEVRGDAIWIDSAQRDRVRMDLAALGLPQAGSDGYELLDGMSGFGTTSQMFDAAYWRAKEGELGRTILALPNVKSARVHLSVPSTRGYRRDGPGTASVTLTTRGGPVTPDQARSLQFLVSSGVPGMGADAVTVIDAVRGVVSGQEEPDSSDRETAMKRNVERILEPHVGAGNAIVELHLEIERDAEQMTEQRFDPQQRALISQEVEETSDTSADGGSAGPVSAASNLPQAQSGSGDSSQSARTETRQRSNFEVSQVTREVVRQPGATRRLTVAVLVNGVPGAGADGAETMVPRGDAELAVLRELVASAVGLDEERGDLLTVKSLPFAAMSDDGTMVERPGLLETLRLADLARIALIGIFGVIIAALVLRPALKARAGLPAPAAALPPAVSDLPLAFAEPAMDTAAPPPFAEAGGFPMLSMATPDFSFAPAMALGSVDTTSAVGRLRDLMRDRHDESVRILSDWIGEPEGAPR